jgi:hypothetical protein
MLHLFYTIAYDKIRYFIYIFYSKTDHGNLTDLNKMSLKIPKGQSESVYRRRTDNKMANNDLQNIHIKLKIE